MPITIRACAAIAALLAAAPAFAQQAYDLTRIPAAWDSDYGQQDTQLSASDDKLVYYAFGAFPQFTYYGVTYPGVWIETNGVLDFAGGPMSFDPFNSAAKLSTTEREKVAPAWDDWVLDVSGVEPGLGVWVKQGSDSFVVTWIARHYHGAAGDQYPMQAVLHADGSIQFNYLPPVDVSGYLLSLTVGIAANAWDTSVFPQDTSGAQPAGVSYLFTPHRDVTPPVTTPARWVSGWTADAVGETLTATDDESGVASTWSSLDGAPWSEWSPSTGLLVSDEGWHTFSFYSIDGAGNVEATQTMSFGIDHTPPAISIASPVNGAQFKLCAPVAATYTVADALSGIASAVPASGTALATSVPGTHTFTVTATDVAGNVASATSTYTVKSTGQKCR